MAPYNISDRDCNNRTSEIKVLIKELSSDFKVFKNEIDQRLDLLMNNHIHTLGVDVAVIMEKLKYVKIKNKVNEKKGFVEKVKDNSWIGILILGLLEIIRFLLGMGS